MSIPTLPSLNLSFEKKTNKTQKISNNSSAKNNVVLNIITPHPVSPVRMKPPPPLSVLQYDPTQEIEEEIEEEKNEPKERELYQSPTFIDIEQEFKDNLLSFSQDLLLNDVDLLKNVLER
jgi:hypothetical protein